MGFCLLVCLLTIVVWALGGWFGWFRFVLMGSFALGFGSGVGWCNMVPRLPILCGWVFGCWMSCFVDLAVVECCGLVSLVGLFAV